MATALGSSSALAQDGGATTVVPKSTPSNAVGVTGATPSGGSADALRPAQDVATTPVKANEIPPPPPVEAAGSAGEIDGGTIDEGAGWEAAVEAAPGPTPLIGPERDQAVAEINAYFNNMESLQGHFRQIDGAGKEDTGRFYVQRPGKLRFDYAPPSPLRIVSDGRYLAIEDSNLKTIEKYPLKSTPFRLLLGKTVDIARDSDVVGAARGNNELSVQLQDKGDGSSGSIQLVFDTKPEMQLSQWVITDAQGLTTTVYLENLGPGRKVASDFFRSKQSFNPFQ
ncbi:outer-membrane lipoprotein carrier protein LolA [Methyloligella sp. 2.7D]|uniref:LolA family protein n=1 Tax=unclassified Methyloligella TaxID=2625955 RepID=UPI00157DA47A|nr:outer membrane lipoprotein carrier protein LolA [Methyloligella sp. GL2]QKP76255.1 outer-membrane lipoprotein carrier protein LolA [Methyloligella sp. GL2]